MNRVGQEKVYETLATLGIEFDYEDASCRTDDRDSETVLEEFGQYALQEFVFQES